MCRRLDGVPTWFSMVPNSPIKPSRVCTWEVHCGHHQYTSPTTAIWVSVAAHWQWCWQRLLPVRETASARTATIVKKKRQKRLQSTGCSLQCRGSNSEYKIDRQGNNQLDICCGIVIFGNSCRRKVFHNRRSSMNGKDINGEGFHIYDLIKLFRISSSSCPCSRVVCVSLLLPING